MFTVTLPMAKRELKVSGPRVRLGIRDPIYRSTAIATALPPPRQSAAMPRCDVAANHFIDQRDQDARAAGADGMADRHRAAVHVDLVGIQVRARA